MGILRTSLIALSHSRILQDAIVRVPVTHSIARRFVAGESLAEALTAVRSLNDQGMNATLDHLGENVATRDEALVAAEEYLRALDALKGAHVHCNVSVKLTQLGLDLGEEFCLDNTARIVQRAADLGNFVRIDMEGSPYTGRTLAIYRELRNRFTNTGIVIQAYLHRSQGDVESLIREGFGHFRLCKGAYDEPDTIAYRDKRRVTRALNELVSTCLLPEAMANGCYCGVASHDQDVINFTRAYAYQRQIDPDRYEFQMLYGIRRELQTELARRGYRVRIYVPYGTHWYPYFMRRLAERPANLTFFLRALFGD